MKRTLLRFGAVLSLAGFAVAGFALSAPRGATAAPVAASTIPAQSNSCNTEGSPLDEFGATVNQLGEAAYSGSFAGTMISGCNLSIFIVENSNTAAFLQAVSSADSSEVPYTTTQVTTSWAAMAGLTSTLASAYSTITAEGVSLRGWGPNPATDSVLVTLSAPTSTQIAQLASTLRSAVAPPGITTAVSGANYQQLAGQVLEASYGPGLSIAGAYGAPLTFMDSTCNDRYNDCSPFLGGDQISHPVGGGVYTECTGGFGVSGNASGHDFMLTAGHCGTTSAWDLTGDDVDMGSTATNYFQDSQHDDFETIYTLPHGSSSAGEGVWGNDGASFIIAGTEIPAQGSKMTFDGSVTGEVRGASVGDNDLCQVVGGIETCHLIEGTDSNTICQGGDSGGPVYVHIDDTGTVNAVGEIDLGSSTDCYAFEIGEAESSSNTTILSE